MNSFNGEQMSTVLLTPSMLWFLYSLYGKLRECIYDEIFEYEIWYLVRSNKEFLSYSYRWIKFEEDVEEGGNRWSKPHVATLTLHSLFELRSMLLNGTVMLDMDASSLEQVADLVLDNMVNAGSLPFDCREKVNWNII